MDSHPSKIRISSSSRRLGLSSLAAPEPIVHLRKNVSSKSLLLRTNLATSHPTNYVLPKSITAHRRHISNQGGGTLTSKVPYIKTSAVASAFHTPHRNQVDLSIPAKLKDQNISIRRSASNSVLDSAKVSMQATQLLGQHRQSVVEKLPLPLSPAEVLSCRPDELSVFEQTEVTLYSKVYFLSDPACKRKDSAFDNDRGDYNLIMGEHLSYRYEVLSILGKGSFGVVAKCLDHKRHEEVAIKIIKNKKLFHQQGAVEVKVLQTICDLDKEAVVPIVRLRGSFLFRKHLCIVFEMLNRSLYDFMKINRFQGLPASLIRKFAVQILQALAFIKKLRIIHCDVKPENILLKHEHKSGLKLIDFGSACFDSAKVYNYIQSRFYRAPEIILGSSYTTSIDMWSFGCILIELSVGVPVFPGENERDQLSLFMEVLGPPPPAVLSHSAKRSSFFSQNNSPKMSINSRGRVHYPGAKTLEQVVGIKDPQFLHLVQRCLDWSPLSRITPEEALMHPWICETQTETSGIKVLVRKSKSQTLFPAPSHTQRGSDFSTNARD